MLLQAPDIRFPGLGIEIESLPNGITLPIGDGFEVKFYGIIIGIGILCGYLIACQMGKREKISSDTIIDFLLYAIVFSIIGARLYYVVFSWDYYKNNPLEILNLRGGGLAIYGGVIAAFLTLYVYTRLKKMSFFQMADCCVPGLALGQMIGRWGNFFNCEAFGGYSDGFLSMWIQKSRVYSGYITEEINQHLAVYEGAEYIQVHPTFLYESLWNLGVVLILVTVHRRKKFNGQIFWMYLGLYGLGRVWIEGLRTDQLLIGGTGIAVSQLLSACLIVVSVVMIVIQMRRKKHMVS
ncbi:MAG: prolipoprotein diacylglyceryl transferase [Lachnospiraceae bacterium]|nr:prolipoprotein diacylglyceryl transferase [Lachnospiraceae bacterium]